MFSIAPAHFFFLPVIQALSVIKTENSMRYIGIVCSILEKFLMLRDQFDSNGFKILFTCDSLLLHYSRWRLSSFYTFCFTVLRTLLCLVGLDFVKDFSPFFLFYKQCEISMCNLILWTIFGVHLSSHLSPPSSKGTSKSAIRARDNSTWFL